MESYQYLRIHTDYSYNPSLGADGSNLFEVSDPIPVHILYLCSNPPHGMYPDEGKVQGYNLAIMN